MESTPQKIQPYKVSELSFTDADSPALIDVKYNGSEEATLTIDADGGDSSSKLKITITTGSNTYVITPSTDDTNDAEATTLGALVKLINELSENVDGDHYGWHARLRHGYSGQDIDKDDFADLAATTIGFDWTPALYHDMSALASGYSAVRLCNPDFDQLDPLEAGVTHAAKGKIAIGRISANVAFASTAPSFVILDNDGNELFGSAALTTGTTRDSDDEEWFTLKDPVILTGPVLVGLEINAVITGITNFRVHWKPYTL